jgi:hypothetical protein
MTSQDTTRRHTVYLYVQIPIFHITHLEYSSYTQTLHGIPPIVRTKHNETSFEFLYVLLH